MTMEKEKAPDNSYFCVLSLKRVNVEDAGKYKVTGKNELGESNATISLNFDSKPNSSFHLLTSISFHFKIHFIGILLRQEKVVRKMMS